MKRLDFTTSKGKFAIIDCDEEGKVRSPSEEHTEIGRLQYINTQHAARIIPKHQHYTPGEMVEHHELYMDYENNGLSYTYTALDSLYSLIRSKGYHFFTNPMKIPEKGYISFDDNHTRGRWEEDEKKVLVNPIIFKLT